MINKDHLRETMLKLEQAEFEHAREKYQDFVRDAQVDDSDGYDNDEVSQAWAAGNIANAFDDAAHDHEEKISYLESLDFSPKDIVGPGAVVTIGKKHYVIAVSTDAFECEGHRFIGISQQAPIYEAIEGLAAGEEFTFNNMNSTIREVY